jgi:hypothetical protein
VSKYNNVNPDHYKLRGRERPGKGIVPKEHPKTTQPIEEKRWKKKLEVRGKKVEVKV